MMVVYIFLWLAITLTCVFIISIIFYEIDCNTGMGILSFISEVCGFFIWIYVIVFAGNVMCSPKLKYRLLLEDRIKAERNVEKYLIDHPELKGVDNDTGKEQMEW